MDTKAQAETLKNKGNDFFKAGDYKDAIAAYSEAITLDQSNPVYYSNRAMANFRIENFGSVITDAEQCLKLDAKFVKAFYRRGSAYFILGKYGLAMKDFAEAIKLEPQSREARDKYAQAKEADVKAKFAAAIAVEEKSAFQSVDIENMVVEPSYNGIHMPADLTLPFVQGLLEDFKNQKKIHKKYLYQLLLKAKTLFEKEPSLVDITADDYHQLTVCGDTHGQFYDLLNIFHINGYPSDNNMYLFNGDFVDRGSFSAEVVIALLAFKVLYPKHFFMARGNHESRQMNKMYGFEGEIKAKYSENAYEMFQEVFCALPLAHCINNKVLVVHGGLFGTDGVKLDDIRKVYRFREPPSEGIMADLMWADPQPTPGRSPSKRGVGFSFGPDVTEKFLKDNNLSLIVRSHEVKQEGYEEEHGGKVITVFSAPNYCDQVGNKGAFIRFGADNVPKFRSYEAVPHPNVKPMQYANQMFAM